MAYISHRWPFINPMTLDQISVDWWAYYVRAAEAEVAEMQEERRGSEQR